MRRHSPRAAFAAFLCLLGFVAPASFGDLTVTIAAPPAEVQPGTEVPLTLFFLNTGTDPAPAALPAEIPARLTFGNQSTDIKLRRQLPATSPTLSPGTIAPGAFQRATYLVNIPGGMSGTIAIELLQAGSPRSALVVAKPAAGFVPNAAQPAGTAVVPAAPDVPPASTTGIAEYVPLRFSAHEPIYFLVGSDRPNAKFQVSFKYQIFDADGPLAKDLPFVKGFYLAYTQTSLWDLQGDSAPFYDTTYRPEFLWAAKDLTFDTGIVSRLGLAVGVQHQSNGKSGADSRSLNNVYIQPSITFGDRGGLFLTVAPKIVGYVGGLSENPDIRDYRGYGEIKAIIGERNGLQLAAIGRFGQDWNKGSVEVDLSYPIGRFFNNNIDLYLHGQYFNGFGESLLDYNESTNVFRLGVSLVR